MGSRKKRWRCVHLFKGLVAKQGAVLRRGPSPNEPPIGSLFSAFLGYNPIKRLSNCGVLNHLPAKQLAYITGRSWCLRKLIEQPFASGLHLAFTFAAIATLIAIIASALRGKRYVHSAPVEAEAPVDAVLGEMVSLPVDAELGASSGAIGESV